MPQPTIIQGPAFVLHNSYAFYTTGDVTISYVRATWNPEGSIQGKLGERLASSHITVGFTPVGMISAATLAKYWPWVPSDVGKSGFPAGPLTCAVVPIVGNKITFPRSGITQPAPMQLSAHKTAWGAMEITCLGNPAVEPTNAAYFQSIAATSADTSFDPTQIISPRATAVFGSLTGMEPDEDGFMVEPSVEFADMVTGNFGLVEKVITSLELRARFKPIGLTEAGIATLLALQDSAALRPGDSIGTATDLVITAGSLTVTCKNMGAKDASLIYAPGRFRQGEVGFVNELTASGGAINALWSIA